MAGSNLVQAVLRGTEIVEAVTRAEDGLTLNEISLQLKLKTTTVYNLLRTFCAAGWLERNSEGKYFMGTGLLSAVRSGSGSAVLSQASPLLQELGEQFPEATVTFTEFTDDGIWCRLRVSPDRPGTVQRRMLQRFMPYTSASGLLLQALLSEEEFAPITQFYPFSDYGIGVWKNAEALEKYLSEVREVGYASTPSSSDLNMAIALPVQSEKAEENELRYVLGLSLKNTAKVKKSEILESIKLAASSLSQFV